MINFDLNKEIIARKKEEIRNISFEFGYKIQEKESELAQLREKLSLIERPLLIELESLYKERKEHIQKYIDDLDLLGERVILPSKKEGIVKQSRISPKGNLILEIEVKDDVFSKREQHPYQVIVFYRDYLDAQLKKILE